MQVKPDFPIRTVSWVRDKRLHTALEWLSEAGPYLVVFVIVAALGVGTIHWKNGSGLRQAGMHVCGGPPPPGIFRRCTNDGFERPTCEIETNALQRWYREMNQACPAPKLLKARTPLAPPEVIEPEGV